MKKEHVLAGLQQSHIESSLLGVKFYFFYFFISFCYFSFPWPFLLTLWRQLSCPLTCFYYSFTFVCLSPIYLMLLFLLDFDLLSVLAILCTFMIKTLSSPLFPFMFSGCMSINLNKNAIFLPATQSLPPFSFCFTLFSFTCSLCPSHSCSLTCD